MSTHSESEPERERQFQAELRREISPEEREFLENELAHSRAHHEAMKQLLETMPELDKHPVFLADLVHRGTAGKKFFTALNPELLNYFLQIQTGRGYNPAAGQFDYRQFSEQTFRYMFGFGLEDRRFQFVRTVDPQSRMPENPEDYSLILGSGGEINQLNTQEQYAEMLDKVKPFFRKVLDTRAPFAVMCATHQILGQVAHERSGRKDLIIKQLNDPSGKPIYESGVIDLFTTEAAHRNKLSSELPVQFSLMSNHGQYLSEIPTGAESLAGNNFAGMPISTQVLAYENGIGVQAHPEFSPAVELVLNRLDRADAVWGGKNVPAICKIDPRPTWIAREKIFPKVLNFTHSRAGTVWKL